MCMSAQQRAIVDSVESWVRDRLDAGNSRAHGWHHTGRVRRNILVLARSEAVDPVLAELSALLHDVGRTEPGPEEEHGARSAAMAEPLLTGLCIPAEDREGILHAVRWHNSRRRDTPLLGILRDADMLDHHITTAGRLIVEPGANHQALPATKPCCRWSGTTYSTQQRLGEWRRTASL